MNLTQEQRKWMWIAAAIFIFWYVVRPMIFYAIEIVTYPARYAQMASARQRQAKLSAETLGIPLNRLLGIWDGRAEIANRGPCSLKFELRQRELGQYAGFSTLTCGIQPKSGQPDSETAILSGAAENGSFRFRVEKVVAPDAKGCAPSSFTLTPFGVTQLAAEWKEPTCSGGHVLMTRTKP